MSDFTETQRAVEGTVRVERMALAGGGKKCALVCECVAVLMETWKYNFIRDACVLARRP